MNCELLCEVSFFLLQTTWWKIQRWAEQAEKLMDEVTVWWKLGDVGTRLWGNKFERLGVSLQQVTKPSSKCDSFHFWQFGENKGQKLPAVLDTRIAASGTSAINGIGAFTWFKSPTSAKEASAGVTKCNWGYWSMAHLWTAGASLTLLRGYWELITPAPHFSPKGSARAGISREPPNCAELTLQCGHISISDLNPPGTIMSPRQHMSLIPSTCSFFPSDYFQVLWDCFQWR